MADGLAAFATVSRNKMNIDCSFRGAFLKVRLFSSKQFAMAVCGIVGLIISAEAPTWASENSYSASGLPYSYETAGIPGNRQVREFNIEVTDAFKVTTLSVDLNVFTSNVSKTDFKIVSPSGTIVWLAYISCNQIPVSFGSRSYEDETHITNSFPNPVGIAGTPANYRFEDGGADMQPPVPHGPTSARTIHT